jgi:hypothetical protein
MSAAPSLDALAQDPARIASLAPADAAHLLGQALAVVALLAGASRAPASAPAPEADHLISAEDAAQRLSLSVGRFYKAARAGRYPFVVRDGPRVRVSTRGLERWLARRQGA